MTAYTECAFQNGSEHKIVFDGDKTVQFKHDNRYWITVRVETGRGWKVSKGLYYCLLYTSPSPRDKRQSRMPSSA